jgi:hypothetical protein
MTHLLVWLLYGAGSTGQDREAIKAKAGEARERGTNADLLPWPSGALESITDA